MDGICLRETHAFTHLWILYFIATYHHACIFDMRLIAELSRQTKEMNGMEKGEGEGRGVWRIFNTEYMCVKMFLYDSVYNEYTHGKGICHGYSGLCL